MTIVPATCCPAAGEGGVGGGGEGIGNAPCRFMTQKPGQAPAMRVSLSYAKKGNNTVAKLCLELANLGVGVLCADHQTLWPPQLYVIPFEKLHRGEWSEIWRI